ncbi:REPEAT-CONTAINING PROTEIN putative-RELATED [Salix viminalis]|uniref:REPEAT-CONTAINING PROTEIN putative-RELATED n=1 Tax=Salix viminalis TaxID=40686 RepID=A0A9Q0U6X4_SALVM|nr:REPEAT-CONTAINING PROTEIN putative-RELATED [Salix viminalis]
MPKKVACQLEEGSFHPQRGRLKEQGKHTYSHNQPQSPIKAVEGKARHWRREPAQHKGCLKMSCTLRPARRRTTIEGTTKAETNGTTKSIMGSSRLGEVIDGMVIKLGLVLDVFVGNALVGMYGKCGVVDEVMKVFDFMPEMNLVSWNSMICAFSENEFSKESFDLLM